VKKGSEVTIRPKRFLRSFQNPDRFWRRVLTLSLPHWSPWSMVIRVTNVTIMITMVINSTITMLIMTNIPIWKRALYLSNCARPNCCQWICYLNFVQPQPPNDLKMKGLFRAQVQLLGQSIQSRLEVCTFLYCSPIQGSSSCTFYCQMQILFIWKQNLWLTQLSLLSGPLLTWKAQIWPENVLYLDQLWLIRSIFWANSDPQHACFGSNFTYKVAWPVLPTSAFIHCK